MRTVTFTKTYYKYDELTEDQKLEAIDKFAMLVNEDEWWLNTYEDAESNSGLEIQGFDLDYRNINGKFTEDAEHSIKLVLENHGKSCNTYQTALRFKAEFDELNKLNPENEALQESYLYAICQDYLDILTEEYAYQTSRECIEESIKANEYEFDADGNIV
jgi:hypothetical protein